MLRYESTFNIGYPLFLGRQIGITVSMLNLLSWKGGATEFENLKNSNPGSLVHDGIVKAKYCYVIVKPLSLFALTTDFESWVQCSNSPACAYSHLRVPTLHIVLLMHY